MRILRAYSASIVAIFLSIGLVLSLVQLGQGVQPLETALASSPQTLATSTDSAGPIAVAARQLPAETVLQQRMRSPYTPGAGSTPLGTVTSGSDLARLGYDAQDVFTAGIKVVPHDGAVAKQCGGLSGNQSVSGLAIKAGVVYAQCPDGQTIIPNAYQDATKCSVHYAATSGYQHVLMYVLAHELGHCFHFIYGDSNVFANTYQAIRPAVSSLSAHQADELFAEDFAACRHGLASASISNNYYDLYLVERPTATQCNQLNDLYDRYFPL